MGLRPRLLPGQGPVRDLRGQAYAFTHYDFDVYEDYDRDYAFVAVYNGIQLGAGTTKKVSKAEFDK